MAKTVAPGVQKLGERHYRVWWTEQINGRRRSQVVRGTLEEAKRLRDAKRHTQTTGEYVSPDAVTLQQYVDAWLDLHETMGETRDTTHDRYKSLLNAVCDRLGHVRLQDLTKDQIEAYYAWCLKHETTRRGQLVGRDTVGKRHTILKRVLEDACQEEPPLIQRNPAARAKHPTAGKPHAQAFTREEAQIVLAAVHESWIDLPVRIALYSGLRLGEVMALRWRYVDLPKEGPGSITVAAIVSEKNRGYKLEEYAKTSHSRRTVAIGTELADTLREHRKAQAERRLRLGVAWESNDLVVCGQTGQILRPSKVTARLTPMIRLLEEDGTLATSGATFHTLRHTHATLLLRDRVPVHVVSKRLGHSRVQITLDYYAHVIPSDDEAVAVSFDGLLNKPYENRTMHMDCTYEAAPEVEAASL